MNSQTWFRGTLFTASIVFAQAYAGTPAHAQVPEAPPEAVHDGPLGEWVFVPDHPTEVNGDYDAYGRCEFDMGLPGEFFVRLGVAGYAVFEGPDQAWGTAYGNGWDRFRAQAEGRHPTVAVDMICGTGPDTDLEVFYGTARISWNETPYFTCPEHKPLLMAARCQTQTLWL